MKSLILLPIILACASAPSTKLSDEAKNIEVFTARPVGCAVVGKVEGRNNMGSKELALNDALNKAAALDATGLLVNQEVPNGKKVTVYATAYQCD